MQELMELENKSVTISSDERNLEQFGGTVKRGDVGPEVSKVQEALVDLGITSVKEVDGAFGINTEAGIQEFQGTVGLPRTGVLDVQTKTALLGGEEVAKPLDFSSFDTLGPNQKPKAATVSEESIGGLYASKGKAYKDSEIKAYSYYNDTIKGTGPRGSSRVHGDASKEVQKTAIETIIAEGKKAGMNNDDIALTLAIARVESGFNPDAAAGTTSAHGLGQFVDQTGEGYGLTDENRWDVNEQARALVAHTQDNIERAEKNGRGREYVYAYHHDGPSLKYGGLAIGKANVTPRVASFLKLVEGEENGG
tara:strand:+ start:935 stop:1858 length:924 start_codon:yes stop_codon:yes gene_type:complete